MWSNPFYSFNNYFSQCRCEGKALKRKEWSEHISHLSVYASSVWPCKTACGSFRYPNQVGILATHHHVVCSFLCWRPGTISCHAWSDKLLSNRFCQSLPDNGFFFLPPLSFLSFPTGRVHSDQWELPWGRVEHHVPGMLRVRPNRVRLSRTERKSGLHHSLLQERGEWMWLLPNTPRYAYCHAVVL